MKAPHLVPAALASALVALAVAVGTLYAERTEARVVHALAPDLGPIKLFGRAFQVQAFGQPDLLPIYGSSEFDSFLGPYLGSELFATYPTGFTIFQVGAGGTTPLNVLQKLAAVGPELRGKKIVICLSPTFFRAESKVKESYYGGNFSRMQSGELAFGTQLTFELKRDVARRMLAYPETLKDEGLLRFALEQLADGSLPARGMYYALFPLGKLQVQVRRLQDHWQSVAYVAGRANPATDAVRRPMSLEWPTLLADADRYATANAANNPFGFETQYWIEHGRQLANQRNGNSDSKYLRSLREDLDWGDFELLLRAMRELGTEPLLLSVPMKGPYYDYWGVSARARAAYYNRTRQLAASYSVPLRDFKDFDGDKYFTADDRSHPSMKGWAHYDRALDAFFHGRPVEGTVR